MCVVPPGFKFSFSCLESFNNCSLAWKMHYIDKLEEDQNYYAEYGTAVHQVLEGWAKGEIPDFAMAEEWEEIYEEHVLHAPPPYPKGQAEKNYNLAKDYFEHFDGFGDQYSVVSAEEKFEVEVEGYIIRGLADLVLQDKNDGEYVIIDHKTKSTKTMANDFDTYVHQLYIYAMYVHQKFGKYPKKMAFNLIKDKDIPFEEEFSMAGLERTKRWIVDTIEKIKQSKEWIAGGSPFFCQFICGYRYSCPVADSIIHAKKAKRK